MELYTSVAYDLARRLTHAYSTSFGLASRLYARPLRKHIYAIYGMVRVADEIVDTYKGSDAGHLLDGFEADVNAALTSGYSANPIIQAFATTARAYGIDGELTAPFFVSMRTDLVQRSFIADEYATYIYGSAEVVGLMCLKVFCGGNAPRYDVLAPGAKALGSAYQKVNFLRDFAADWHVRGRVYFPAVTFETFDDAAKTAIVADIKRDFAGATPSINDLPRSARRAVRASYRYYSALLKRLERMSADDIKRSRAHVPAAYKLAAFAAGLVGV